MEESQVPCPYCGCMIDNNVERCPHCNETFKEHNIPVKVDSLGLFIILNCVTLGFFQFVWLLFNMNNINLMVLSKKDKLKFDIPLFILVFAGIYFIMQFCSYIFYLFGAVSKLMILAAAGLWLISSPVFWIICILTYVITYRILRIIEKYTLHEYGVKLTHSETGWLFCPILFIPIFSPMFYLIYFIYTYKERVYNPKPVEV